MKDMLLLVAHLLTTMTKLLGPGGMRAVIADTLLMNRLRPDRATDQTVGPHG